MYLYLFLLFCTDETRTVVSVRFTVVVVGVEHACIRIVVVVAPATAFEPRVVGINEVRIVTI